MLIENIFYFNMFFEKNKIQSFYNKNLMKLFIAIFILYININFIVIKC